MVDLCVQHRDPDGNFPHQEIRSRGRDRVARSAEREIYGRDEPARDAEPNDRAFAFCGADPIEHRFHPIDRGGFGTLRKGPDIPGLSGHSSAIA